LPGASDVPVHVAENTVEESMSIEPDNIAVGVADPPCPPVQAEQEASRCVGNPTCRTAIEESNRLLEVIANNIEHGNRVLIGTQRSLMRVSQLVSFL
jgi:sulfite reductase beta subunit-like hemoprotein